MTGFNHTLAGSIIAVLVPAPFVPLVAFMSHFVLDAVPHFGNLSWAPDHGDRSFSRKFVLLLIGDAIGCFASLFFAWWLFPDKWLIITIGAFFAAGPDFLWLIDGKIKWLKPFFRFATWIQWGERPWGWTLEIVYATLFCLLLIRLS